MAKIYSYFARFEQPVHVSFQCEYCNQVFSIDGKLTAGATTEKYLTERADEAKLELRARGETNLQNTRADLERFLAGSIFPSNYSSEDRTIRFSASNNCPDCDYRQRMADPPEAPLKTRSLRRVVVIGCAGFVLFFYFVILINLIRGVEFDLKPYAIPILIGVPLLAALGSFLIRNPNRAFMKKHRLKKQDLPQPRKPDIQYGQITAVS